MNAPPPYQPPPPQQPYPSQQGYGPPPGQTGQAGPPPKKSGGGCLLALGIVGGIILLIGLVVAFFVYRFVSSPDGKKIVSAVSSGAALVAQATNAPGTKELRALGCTQAMVIDAAQVAAVADAFGDGGTTKVDPDDSLAVVCVTTRGATKPGCEEVAATYVAAVGQARGAFAVSVGASGGQSRCEQRYSADGKLIAKGPGATRRP